MYTEFISAITRPNECMRVDNLFGGQKLVDVFSQGGVHIGVFDG